MSIDNTVSTNADIDASIIPSPENSETPSRFSALPLFHGISRGVSQAGVALALALIAILFGVLAAIAAGADVAISVLIGYCSVTSTLAACSFSSRSSAPESKRAVASISNPRKTSDAWKLVSTLTVADASRLWCDVEPGATTTQDTIAWGRALTDAIKSGDLPIVSRSDAGEDVIARERSNPHYMTQVSRDALKSWAARHGYAPNFLRD